MSLAAAYQPRHQEESLCLVNNRPRLKSETYARLPPRPEDGSPA